MRRLPILRIVVAFCALAGTVYAPPFRAPPIHPEPIRPFHPEPIRPLHPEPYRAEPRDRSAEHIDQSRPTDADSQHSASVATFEFPVPPAETGTAKDQDGAEPFVYSALPKGDAFEHIFGDRFSAAKEHHISAYEGTALGIRGAQTRISNDFRRSDLLAHVAAHRGKRPFILVCHSEGPNENRDIPLGDDAGAKITENELRAVCAANDTELFLVSCHSKDLKISKEISYGEAFRIIKLAMDISAASATPLTVAQLKEKLVETAKKELTPGDELRISFGGDVKKVVVITAASSGSGADDFWNFNSCLTTLVAIVIAFFVIRSIYRSTRKESG